VFRAAAALAVIFALGQTPLAAQRVLFIGNSLTYANDLPKLVETLARAKGVQIKTEMVAFPDFSLEDHWQQGDALRAIRRGGWSLVVLQQGPSAMPESQVLLREYVKRFDAEIRKAGGKTGLYMVWPSRARMQDFAGVGASYRAAAKEVGGLLFPAGEAWQAAWTRDSSLALYSPDGLHPSREGTYLAALVIATKAFGVSPMGMPAPGIAPATARLLQDVVLSIRDEFLSRMKIHPGWKYILLTRTQT
jgi:hypothetical protein